MNHVLPAQITKIMSELQDSAVSEPFEIMKPYLEQELGRPLEEMFTEFDSKPIAAASLAQVHRARTVDGREVAVKIQYPGLVQKIDADLTTMAVLTRAAGIIFPDFEFSWLIPEFRQNAALETDFLQEGRNGERVSGMFAHTDQVKVPKVYWDLSTKHVLCMEFVRGERVTDVQALRARDIDPLNVARLVSTVFGDMTFYHGFVHCDPHPGNLMVDTTQDGRARLIVIDHGMYRRLHPEFRRSYCKLWKALVVRDTQLLQEAATELGVGRFANVLPLAFTFRSINSNAKLGGRMTKEERDKVKEDFKDFKRSDANDLMKSLPRDMLFVMRSTNIVRSLNLALGGTSQMRFHSLGASAIRGLTAIDTEVSQRAMAVLQEDATKAIVEKQQAGTGGGLVARLTGTADEVEEFMKNPHSSVLGGRLINVPVESELTESLDHIPWGRWWRIKRELWKLSVNLWATEVVLGWVMWWLGGKPHSDKEAG